MHNKWYCSISAASAKLSRTRTMLFTLHLVAAACHGARTFPRHHLQEYCHLEYRQLGGPLLRKPLHYPSVDSSEKIQKERKIALDRVTYHGVSFNLHTPHPCFGSLNGKCTVCSRIIIINNGLMNWKSRFIWQMTPMPWQKSHDFCLQQLWARAHIPKISLKMGGQLQLGYFCFATHKYVICIYEHIQW